MMGCHSGPSRTAILTETENKGWSMSRIGYLLSERTKHAVSLRSWRDIFSQDYLNTREYDGCFVSFGRDWHGDQ